MEGGATVAPHPDRGCGSLPFMSREAPTTRAFRQIAQPSAADYRSNTQMSSVLVSARGEDRIRHGHPWIYQSDIRQADAAPGAIVRVLGPGKRMLGSALFSDRSQITLRMFASPNAASITGSE